MNILIVGATGATGSQLVKQLLFSGHHVTAIVRSKAKLEGLTGDLNLLEASLLEMTDEELIQITKGCDVVASCLGHNLTRKGLFGKPRRLVTDATRKLCEAIVQHKPAKPVKFILMNTTANRNRDLEEKVSFGHRLIIGLLRLLLPPHVDNEQAADYLRVVIGQNNPYIEWAAVRPDGLVDEDAVSKYIVHPSPTRDPVFNAGTVSRINVAAFMAELATDEKLWKEWKGQMPVIYSEE